MYIINNITTALLTPKLCGSHINLMKYIGPSKHEWQFLHEFTMYYTFSVHICVFYFFLRISFHKR
jgi:hypothetical protein